MKLALSSAVFIIGSLFESASAEDLSAPPNSTSARNSTARAGIKAISIVMPVDGISPWWYNSRAEGPYGCTSNHDTRDWAMLRAYRSGGTQGVHWKYTNDPGDSDCITQWTYYGSDGKSVIKDMVRRTTSEGDTKRWCALPVYRSGGVLGKQWNYCELYDNNSDRR